MNLVLIGFMGSGKSTVARILSERLSMPCLEMDDFVLQKAECQTMHQVFEKGGESLWRAMELKVALECAKLKNHVISTGGGVVLNPIILENFKIGGGKVFFLDTSFETLVKRIGKDTSRPLFQDHFQAKKLYDSRIPLYLQFADVVIDTDSRSPREVAIEVLNGI